MWHEKNLGDIDSAEIPDETDPDESWQMLNEPKQKVRDDSRFWAVIIGIDGDTHYPLYGCISDAELMEKYLIEDLGVPSDHIQRLLGPLGEETTNNSESTRPTRANIIKALYSLIDNPDILNGDNIIVYFAGNGARYDAQDYYQDYRDKLPPGVSIASIRPINAICPIDRDAFDGKGSQILDISDREIDAIFSEISQVKHKMMITLILDCGHACARIRCRPPVGSFRAQRNAPSLLYHAVEPMLEDAHQRLAAYPQYLARRCSVTAHDWQPDTSSHVVLAACQKNELAREAEDDTGTVNGVFTKSLVDSLRSGQLKEESSYVDLIAGLPELPYQTPFVAGDYKDEPVWYQEPVSTVFPSHF
ncbi:caspase domain-containing protein [Desarmillaria tabescens]|uniref:Caspase domain-containing protein n=1 Tax=Armillaria tabescens TaxID=1929756 RepID=A0AA39JNG7_ARMTA|nr:caspase domain-containing protein [Desarmillaria tabescens]KAK0445986.1 caspase domain-containing protein [Desarmillaria tabescens]